MSANPITAPVSKAAASLVFDPYQPLFSSGDWQTIVGRFWPARLQNGRWPAESRLFRTEPDVQVLGRVNRLRPDGARPTVLAVHGLTSSSEAPYMLRLAAAARAGGFDVIRLNVRNCGGTEGLCPTLYHSGLTSDLRSVVDQLAPLPLLLAGFSMGGNMVLKLAGEWGERAPAHVRAICAISTPIRLAPCARRLNEARNRLYQMRFLRELRASVRRKQRAQPERFSGVRLEGVSSIYEFDQRITAPQFGFRDADHYYEVASSAAYLDSVRVPALLIQARDDPFIPFETYDDSVFSRNGFLRLLATPRGGHVAFLARTRPRFWASAQAVRFFQAFAD